MHIPYFKPVEIKRSIKVELSKKGKKELNKLANLDISDNELIIYFTEMLGFKGDYTHPKETEKKEETEIEKNRRGLMEAMSENAIYSKTFIKRPKITIKRTNLTEGDLNHRWIKSQGGSYIILKDGEKYQEIISGEGRTLLDLMTGLFTNVCGKDNSKEAERKARVEIATGKYILIDPYVEAKKDKTPLDLNLIQFIEFSYSKKNFDSWMGLEVKLSSNHLLNEYPFIMENFPKEFKRVQDRLTYLETLKKQEERIKAFNSISRVIYS